MIRTFIFIQDVLHISLDNDLHTNQAKEVERLIISDTHT